EPGAGGPGHGTDVALGDARGDRDQAGGMRGRGGAQRDDSTEGEPGEPQCGLRPALTAVGDDGEGGIDPPPPLVMCPRACTDAAEVEADGRCAELLKGAGQRPDDLVVQGAAVEGM